MSFYILIGMIFRKVLIFTIYYQIDQSFWYATTTVTMKMSIRSKDPFKLHNHALKKILFRDSQEVGVDGHTSEYGVKRSLFQLQLGLVLLNVMSDSWKSSGNFCKVHYNGATWYWMRFKSPAQITSMVRLTTNKSWKLGITGPLNVRNHLPSLLYVISRESIKVGEISLYYLCAIAMSHVMATPLWYHTLG